MDARREHYIPLRRTDLVNILANDLALYPDDAAQFRRFAAILEATIHFQYNRFHDELLDAYAPFDPEATTLPVSYLYPSGSILIGVDPAKRDPNDREHRIDQLFDRFDQIMAKANFIELDRQVVVEASKRHSEWGIDMKVDFSIFDRFRLYMRGDVTGVRRIRRWQHLWAEEEVHLPIYQRLVVILKLHPSKRLPKSLDTDDVLIKYFKDIPQADLEMLLPGAKAVMPGFARLKLGGSLLSGLGLMGYNVVKQIVGTAIFGVEYLYGLLVAMLGYGWKQYSGYQSVRHAVSLRLTESLYYQNLANNSGVLFSVLDEAEEQDNREAILAYFFLWRFAGPNGWTMNQLDDAIEKDLEFRLKRPIDFEVDDALAKLERIKLVVRQGDFHVAVPIAQALEQLDYAWDNIFSYNARQSAAA